MNINLFFYRLLSHCPKPGCNTPLVRESHSSDPFCVTCNSFSKSIKSRQGLPSETFIQPPLQKELFSSRELSSGAVSDSLLLTPDLLLSEIEVARSKVVSSPSIQDKIVYIEYIKNLADCLTSLYKLQK